MRFPWSPYAPSRIDQPPFLFEDVLARRRFGNQADELLSYHHTSGRHPILMGTRLAVTARAPYAEDRLSNAVSGGMRQYVILGAGLDSFAYRSTLAAGLAVYEVDEPDTSTWKRAVLDAAGNVVPADVRFVSADLGAVPLIDRLIEAGFDTARPAFVSCLGVTFYLERSAIDRILNAAASLAAGSELVFDHTLPAAERDASGAEYAALAESVGSANGEPWITSLTVDEARTMLVGAGFEILAQPLLQDWVDEAMWKRKDALRPTVLWAMAHTRLPMSQSAPTTEWA